MPSEYDALLDAQPTQQKSEYDSLLAEPPTQAPGVGQILKTAGEAALEVGKGFVKGLIPQANLSTLSEIVNPTTIPFIEGKKLVEDVGQTVKSVQEAEKTPPFSKERFEAGFNVVGQIGMLAAMAKAPTLRETAFGKSPTETPLAESAAAEQIQKGVIRQIAEGDLTKHPGDGESRASAEAGGSGGVVPSTEVQAPQVEPVPQPEQLIETGARPVSAKIGDLVKFTEPSVAYRNGEPITIQNKRSGRVSFLRPDGKIEVKAQDGGYRVFTPEELGYKGGEISEEIQRQKREAVVSPTRTDAEGLQARVSGETGVVESHPQGKAGVEPLAKAPGRTESSMALAAGGAIPYTAGARRVGPGWEPIIEQSKQEMRDAINKADYATPAERADAIDAARNKIQELQAQAHTESKPASASEAGQAPVESVQPKEGGVSEEVQKVEGEKGREGVLGEAGAVEQTAAQPPKVEPSPQPKVGGVHAAALADRPIETPEKAEVITRTEGIRLGNVWLDKGGDPQKIINHFNKTGEVGPTNMGRMTATLLRKQAATDFAKDALRENPNDPALQAKVTASIADEQAFSDAYKPMHSVASASLASLKGMQPLTEEMAQSYSGLERLYQEQTGKTFTPEQSQRAAKLSDQSKELNQQYKADNESVFKAADKEYSKVPSVRKVTTLDDLVAVLSKPMTEVC